MKRPRGVATAVQQLARADGIRVIAVVSSTAKRDFALAAGANFVARAFSGDPNGTADIIAQAIRHPGFSFVEILSPCVTFRPEQRGWKDQVHAASVPETDDPARAARRIMTDDGFNIGVLYAGSRTPYAKTPAASATLAQIEEEFAL